ncbi:hypothetical protein LINGRAPRIM_LOCUS2662 [Linum grandiflorum]
MPSEFGLDSFTRVVGTFTSFPMPPILPHLDSRARSYALNSEPRLKPLLNLLRQSCFGHISLVQPPIELWFVSLES